MSEFSKVLREYAHFQNAFGGYDHEEKLLTEAAAIIDRQDITVDFLVKVIARLTGNDPTTTYVTLIGAIELNNTRKDTQ